MSKKKTKFPELRDMQSATGRENSIKLNIYTTTPSTTVTIDVIADENLQHDLRAAVDEVLKFHGY